MLNKIAKPGFLLLIAVLLSAGCATTSDSESEDAVSVAADPAVATPAPAAAPISTSTTKPVPVAAALETVVYFDFDKSELRPETRALLVAHAENLQAKPRSIVLGGHADERGTREYNMALGERRALAVRDFLRSEGVVSLIEVVSYGEEYPANPASNEVAWQANRRVEIIK